MKFATFNLYQFLESGKFWYKKYKRNCYTTEQWLSKLAWVRQQLLDADADVVGFQEVFSVDALRRLCRKIGYEHFAVVDEPGLSESDGRVYIRSVVALASRWPLLNVQTVALNSSVMQDLGLSDDFQFKRLPVRAQVLHDTYGAIQCYVLHLKSKRPMFEQVAYPKTMDWTARCQDHVARLSRGSIAALLQRGAEASLAYHDALSQIAQGQHVVLMGDLNEQYGTEVYSALTMQQSIYAIGETERYQWPRFVKKILHDCRLKDAFLLAPNTRSLAQPYTHIHHGEGRTLDYVLVSNGLNSLNADAQMEVIEHRVWDQHLDEEGRKNITQSDHALVSAKLIPTRLQVQEEEQSKVCVSRQDFIDLAGGIFQSEQHFSHWNSQDKWDGFWSFFFDERYGWVKSIYGHIPISELVQKQRHSIEHIIPRGFLDRYLTHQHRPRQVRYGAVVNPFNLAPSDRRLNSKRSDFPFDFDGHQVVRPERLQLQQDTFDHAGLDAQNEWVIPARNRGTVARSILYMLLVYEINELYNQHLETLIHWAKINPPDVTEMAYNHWVENKLGIRNPFINQPAKALALLQEDELLNALKVQEVGV